jgi:tetratricopeptide (TPR) repeat protein
MKKFVFSVLTLLFVLTVGAQDSTSAAARAKAFIREGDYNNAILVLNRAIEGNQGDRELKKDLAFAYYLSRDYSKALAVAKPLTETDDADVQSYQILGMVYKAIEDTKEAERMYRAGIRKNPEAGALYSELGEVLWSKKNFGEAARQWIRGIQNDPNYPGNYYNAAKYYYASADKVWGLIYGEIFVNLESYSKRTPEIKAMLLDGYKKLFQDTDMLKNQEKKNAFVRAFLDIMKEQSHVINQGVNPDALSVLRARFVIKWFEKYGTKFPFRLFDYHRQLLREGMFDAYNQWIFGAAQNLSSFQQWTANHAEEYTKFATLQKNRVFKLVEGQFYQSTKW